MGASLFGKPLKGGVRSAMRTVTVLFRHRYDAEEGIAWLRERGYADNEIGIVLHSPVPVSVGATGGMAPEEQAMRHALPIMGTAAGISVAAVTAGIALTVGPAGLVARGALARLLAPRGGGFA